MRVTLLIEAGGGIRNGRISCDDLVYFGLFEAARDERRSRRQPQVSASGLQFPEAADDGANGRAIHGGHRREIKNHPQTFL